MDSWTVTEDIQNQSNQFASSPNTDMGFITPIKTDMQNMLSNSIGSFKNSHFSPMLHDSIRNENNPQLFNSAVYSNPMIPSYLGQVENGFPVNNIQQSYDNSVHMRELGPENNIEASNAGLISNVKTPDFKKSVFKSRSSTKHYQSNLNTEFLKSANQSQIFNNLQTLPSPKNELAHSISNTDHLSLTINDILNHWNQSNNPHEVLEMIQNKKALLLNQLGELISMEKKMTELINHKPLSNMEPILNQDIGCTPELSRKLAQSTAYILNDQSVNSPNSTNYIGIEAVLGRVYELAKDQNGCRTLQRLLENNNTESINAAILMVPEIISHIEKLMIDPFANFLMQRLFELLPNDKRLEICTAAVPYLFSVSLTSHGTFSVQKIIETVSTNEEIELIREGTRDHIVNLVIDQHGNHVVQKILNRFSHLESQYVYEELSKNCVTVATNKQGCCVLQRCIEFASQAQKSLIISSILQSAALLVRDPYGNYVIQYILDSKYANVTDLIGELFLPHLIVLSINKFSSNVVERVIRGVSNNIRDKYIKSMLSSDVLSELLKDVYGNYVVQTALEEASPELTTELANLIYPLLPLLRSAPYIKKLENRIELCLKKKKMAENLNASLNSVGTHSNHKKTSSPITSQIIDPFQTDHTYKPNSLNIPPDAASPYINNSQQNLSSSQKRKYTPNKSTSSIINLMASK